MADLSVPYTLTRDARVTAVPDLLVSNLAGDLVLLNLADGVYYGLDLVGAHIWGQIADPKFVYEIVDDVTAHYNVDKPQCEADVLTFLGDLVAHQLVQIIAPSE